MAYFFHKLKKEFTMKTIVQEDTVKLLRECDAGAKMGVASIDDVLNYVYSDKLKDSLSQSKNSHEQIVKEIEVMLSEYREEGKEPNPIAKGMSWMKTNVKMSFDDSDKTVANLITDGCNMGVKSLNKYLNQYEGAADDSKNIAKRLIKLEEELASSVRSYL